MNVDTGILGQLEITPASAAIALAILLAAWWLSRLARRWVIRAGKRLEGISTDAGNIAARMTSYTVLLLGAAIALRVLGADTQPLLAALLILAAIALLALRGIAANFAAGIIIQTRHPIRIGDEITSLDCTGVVKELNGRSVVIHTNDGQRIHLPNDNVIKNALYNNSVRNARRTSIEIGLRDTTPQQASEVLTAAATAVPGVLTDPAPDVINTGIRASRLIVELRIWHHPLHRLRATSDTIAAAQTAARDAGIAISHIRPLPG